MPSPFSRDSITKAVDTVEAREGNTLNVGADVVPGERPAFTIDAQGEHTQGPVDLTWAAWARSQLTKATTAVGAKVGVKW